MNPNPLTLATCKKRLLLVAALLRKLPRRRFSYEIWVGSKWAGAPDLSCGTTACAMGWATTVPALRRAGLCLDKGTQLPTLKGRGQEPIDDVSKYIFGLDSENHYYLFESHEGTPHTYLELVTPKQVAKKIEHFVANWDGSNWPKLTIPKKTPSSKMLLARRLPLAKGYPRNRYAVQEDSLFKDALSKKTPSSKVLL